MSNKAPVPRRRREAFFDLVTVLLIIATAVVVALTFLLIRDPQTALNPLPPPTLPILLQVPSATPSYTPSATFTPSETPLATDTPTPTQTFTPSLTFTPSATFTLTPTLTLSPTSVLPGLPTNTPAPASPLPTSFQATPLAASGGSGQPVNPAEGQSLFATYPFSAGSPSYQPNLSPAGCDWASIAGTISGTFGEPVVNVAVEVTGENFAQIDFSGNALAFGPSGFEIQVDNQPVQDLFAVRLIGPDGNPLSDYAYVETEASCERNVLMLGFTQNRDY